MVVDDLAIYATNWAVLIPHRDAHLHPPERQWIRCPCVLRSVQVVPNAQSDLKLTVLPDRRAIVQLPEDFEPGETEVTLIVRRRPTEALVDSGSLAQRRYWELACRPDV